MFRILILTAYLSQYTRYEQWKKASESLWMTGANGLKERWTSITFISQERKHHYKANKFHHMSHLCIYNLNILDILINNYFMDYLISMTMMMRIKISCLVHLVMQFYTESINLQAPINHWTNSIYAKIQQRKPNKPTKGNKTKFWYIDFLSQITNLKAYSFTFNYLSKKESGKQAKQ